MNSRQKEVAQAALDSEKTVIRRLKSMYEQSLRDINTNIGNLMSRGDAGMQHVVYQVEYQQALKKQITGILDTLHAKEFSTVSEYLEESYTNGFVGTMYDLHGQGIPLCFPIDERQLVNAITTDSKINEGLYKRLGQDVAVLKRKIQAQVSRGIATGMSYEDIAKQLDMTSNVGYNSAVRIARTEGHRIQVESSMDACNKAKDSGADVLKQWDSTLDNDTRKSHREVDGEIRELDEAFSNGLRYPGDPRGGAGEVCNCRCALLQRARWALDEDELQTLKERAAYFGLDKSENFEDFKIKFLQAAAAIAETAAEASGTAAAAATVKLDESKYRSFETGQDANDFFYYDSEARGLLQRKKSKHGQWKASLSQDEKDAISFYTADGYGDLNQYLRKYGQWQDINVERVTELKKDLTSAIERYELKEPIKVYRAIQPDAFADYADDLQELVGKVYTDPGFMSTSPALESTAVNKDCIMELFIPAGKGHGAYINEFAGQYVDEEFEFLLPTDCKFNIVSAVEGDDGKIHIKMEMIVNE